MARFKKLTQAHEGKVVYCDGIVDGIVELAVSEIPYVELVSKEKNAIFHKNSIKVKIEKDVVYVDVMVKIHYTQCVSDMAFKIQEAIRHNIEAMTEYTVESVNVNIVGVKFGEVVLPINPDNNGAKDASVENLNESTKEG